MNKRPIRFFNTTGPCNPEEHYMLPPEERLQGAQLHRYIRDKLYWVLHAPRQTGKTTFLQNWMREINAASGVTGPVACYVSVEDCQGLTDRDEAMRTIYQDIRDFARLSGYPVFRSLNLKKRKARVFYGRPWPPGPPWLPPGPWLSFSTRRTPSRARSW
jgi:hypothetical protein